VPVRDVTIPKKLKNIARQAGNPMTPAEGSAIHSFDVGLSGGEKGDSCASVLGVF
jgi:hypothetical protein